MRRKGSGHGSKKTGGEGEDPMARRKRRGRHCGGKKTGLAGEDVMLARKQEKRKASWQEQDRRRRGRQHSSKK